MKLHVVLQVCNQPKDISHGKNIRYFKDEVIIPQ